MFRLLFVDQHSGRAPTAEPAASPRSDIAVGFAASIDEALVQARASDLVLVSATLPGGKALDIVRAVASAEPGVRILVKDLADSEYPPLTFIEAGATGWLL